MTDVEEGEDIAAASHFATKNMLSSSGGSYLEESALEEGEEEEEGMTSWVVLNLLGVLV